MKDLTRYQPQIYQFSQLNLRDNTFCQINVYNIAFVIIDQFLYIKTQLESEASGTKTKKIIHSSMKQLKLSETLSKDWLTTQDSNTFHFSVLCLGSVPLITPLCLVSVTVSTCSNYSFLCYQLWVIALPFHANFKRLYYCFTKGPLVVVE